MWNVKWAKKAAASNIDCDSIRYLSQIINENSIFQLNFSFASIKSSVSHTHTKFYNRCKFISHFSSIFHPRFSFLIHTTEHSTMRDRKRTRKKRNNRDWTWLENSAEEFFMFVPLSYRHGNNFNKCIYF